MLNEIVAGLARANNRHFIDLGTALFEASVPEDEYRHDPGLASAIRPGNAYGGFRLMPSVLTWNDLFVTGPKVLMVRDPRDMLVSRYFSDGWSHRMPQVDDPDGLTGQMERQRAQAREGTIDDFVLRRAGYVADALMGYLPLLSSSTTVVLTYEDYVFDKRALIARVADHYDWVAPPATIDHILSRVDVFPETAEPGAHIRQVHPGDHRSQLRADTVQRLNEVLAEVMAPYGYEV